MAKPKSTAKGQSTRALAKRDDTISLTVLADRVIVRLREAETALRHATSIDQVKLVVDAAAAQEVFAHRQKLGEELIGYAHTIKIHALARLGELLAALPMAKGGQPYQKARKPTGSTVVPVETLAELKIDKKTSAVAKQLAAMPASIREAIAEREVTVSKAIRQIRETKDANALRQASEQITEAQRIDLASVCDLRVCSCANLFASGIVPDAVITDPPYPQEFLPVFSELALACASVNVPLVAVMSGQSYLPDVIQRLCAHLRYRWTMAYLTPGGQAVQQWDAKVNTAWKPVLLFGESREWFGDVAVSKPNDNDKRFHGWGQSESGMADLVERLTKPGQLVCDPFLGGGTTALVSLALSRRFVGCDIDPVAVQTTRTRVEAMRCDL